MGGDSTRYTRESMAHEYQLAKYYAGNGENWGANGVWETSRENMSARRVPRWRWVRHTLNPHP